ncbi:hypothetical protein FS837_010919 [Tulasnella sp. UAMH 9824]|nr:hypothetical protein FS837_010919 [Tulasnella sp. UAMH 9824]
MTHDGSSTSQHFPRTLSHPSTSEPKYSHRSAKRPQLEIHTSRTRFSIIGLLSTFCVFATTGGTATLILGWLYSLYDPVAGENGVTPALRSGFFAIRESGASDEEDIASQTHTETLRILTFSALASHLISVTSTILVTLLAYRAARQWLHASENPGDANLTPIQYGLLVRTLGSGSLMSLINTLRYTSRSKRASTPRFFKEAFAGATGIYLLSHAVGLVDLWLHSGARSTTVFRDVQVESDALYGLAYSEARCGPFNKTELPCQRLIYAAQNGIVYANDDPWIYHETYDTISDINPYKKSEYVNGTAILVPGPAKDFQSHGFTINTQGLRVQCSNLRDQCDRLPMPLIQVAWPGPHSGPVTNCSKAGYPCIPYHTSGELKVSGRDTRNIESLVLGVIGDELGGMLYGTSDFSSGWTSNPATTVVQLRWPNNGALRNTPGAVYLNAVDLYATCNLTYLDVVAEYKPRDAEWRILETRLSSPELASVFWTPMLFQIGTVYLLNALRPYIANRGAQTIDILESLLAKQGIGFAAPMMTFTAASNVTTTQLVTLGLYPIAPVLLLVSCLYIYALAALAIFFVACTSNDRRILVPRHLTKGGEQDEDRSALDVAQAWLTDPLPFIGAMFPGGDGRQVARSVESDPLHQVYDSTWESGKVGIGLYKGSKGELVFGLMGQRDPRSRRYGRLFQVEDEERALQEKVGSSVVIPFPALMGSAR